MDIRNLLNSSSQLCDHCTGTKKYLNKFSCPQVNLEVYLEFTQHATEGNTEKVLRSSASGLASNQLSTDFKVV